MAFGVFIHRSDSVYDDSPAERYQFPSQYLGRVLACVGDWVIYYEPRKVPGTRGYFAVAKVQEVMPDPGTPNMHFALIEPGSYLDFPNLVPFSEPEGIIEQGLLNNDGRISGSAQSAVRPISPADFNRIVGLGLADNDAVPPRVDPLTSSDDLQEEGTPFAYEQDRDRVSYLNSRIVRDRVFRRVVLRAYTCINRRPPAEVDLQRHFQVTPPSVHQMIVTLEHAGLIERRPGAPRSVRVLVAPESLPVLR